MMEQAFWMFVALGGISLVLGLMAVLGDALDDWLGDL